MPTNIPADNRSNFFSRTRSNSTNPKLMADLDAVCDAEKPFTEMKRRFGLSMRDVCETYGASYRTLQNWNADVNKPAPFVIRAVVEGVVNNRRRHE